MRPSEKYDFGSVDTLIGDRYRLLSEIGRGTSATVYRALDTQDENECAVKIGEAPQGSNREQRFLREAAIACQIRHTNVVRSNDYGIEDGFLYLVMEFLHGETLGSCLARQAFGRKAAFESVLQVLRALESVHQSGVIHRDVKPNNIFVVHRADGSLGETKLLDFGISKGHGGSQRHRQPLTQKGMVVGTPWYVAPECLRGARDLDPRVDVYSVGVLLFEVVTGALPFRSTQIADLMYEIVKGTAIRVREIKPDCPELLAAIIQKAMAQDRAARFTSATDLCDQLQRFLETSQ